MEPCAWEEKWHSDQVGQEGGQEAILCVLCKKGQSWHSRCGRQKHKQGQDHIHACLPAVHGRHLAASAARQLAQLFTYAKGQSQLIM